MDVQAKVVAILIALMPLSSLAQETGKPQKVCHLTEIKDMGKTGKWPSELESCIKGDIIAFDDEATRLNDFVVAVARLCEIGTISMVNRNIPTAAVCRYTGQVLDVIND